MWRCVGVQVVLVAVYWTKLQQLGHDQHRMTRHKMAQISNDSTSVQGWDPAVPITAGAKRTCVAKSQQASPGNRISLCIGDVAETLAQLDLTFRHS